MIVGPKATKLLVLPWISSLKISVRSLEPMSYTQDPPKLETVSRAHRSECKQRWTRPLSDSGHLL